MPSENSLTFCSRAIEAGAVVKFLADRISLKNALEELVKREGVKKAFLASSSLLEELEFARELSSLSVDILSWDDPVAAGGCELGVSPALSGVVETGSLLLGGGRREVLASSLPICHLAILRSADLLPDLTQALARAIKLAGENNGRLYFVTGPSRTADIENVLTIGVHGPKSLYIFLWEGDVVTGG